MVVGVAQFELVMPYNHSLKEKRHILGKLKERVMSQLHIAVNEVHLQDKWQRAVLGFAVVGNDGKKIESLMEKVLRFIQEMELGQLTAEKSEILFYDDEFEWDGSES